MAEQRKRGDELKDAIFKATLNILNTEGFAAVNFKRVAEEAETNRPSLYRRWDTPFVLVFDAIRDNSLKNHASILESPTIDTGSLRDDLVNAFSHFIVATELVGPEFLRAMISALNHDNPQIQETFATARTGNLEIINNIIKQARARGELINEVSDETKLVPFEVLRYQLMVAQVPLTMAYIVNLVDEIILPALTTKKTTDDKD